MKLSIVTTLYHSAPYIDDFYRRVSAAASKIANDYEIVFVNDGSLDDSLDIAVKLYKKDRKVKILDLSCNFGHHKAIMTGLSYAKGELVFLIDCDLEIKPEVLAEFYNKFNESGADVIYGVQGERQDGLLNILCAKIYYKIFNWLASDPLPMNLTTVRLMSKRYVSALVAHREREILIAGLWAITGFKQIPILVYKSYKKESVYTLRRKIALIVNGIVSFSNKPLIFIFYIGSIISAIATVAALYLIIKRLFFGILLSGWVSLIVSIWLLSGLIMFCLGIIGIYLSKIFVETKQRPYTIIREIYDSGSDL